MKTAKDILVCARDLISDPARWTQGRFARKEDGNEVNPTDPAACKFCAYGAIRHCQGLSIATAKAEKALAQAASETYSRSAVVVNDYLGHKAILKVFDDAIAQQP